MARLDGDRARAMAHYEKASSLLGRASADGLVPRCNLAILRLEVGEAPDGLEEDLAAARLAGRSDLEAIFHTIGLATAAQQHDARGFDDHLRHARHRIAETQLREPDVAALARRSARAWLDAEPPDPRRAVLATELARTQDVARDTALERALCTAGAPAPFGHWLASGRLGAGGMGVVLAGVDPDGRAAAIKVLRPRADQAPASGREFEDEMRAIAALDHPAIISVLGFGRASALAATLSDDCPEGGPWLALEQLPGPSLRPWAGRLPWSSIRQVLLDLLDALAHAHSRGVLHLDIKPDNILLLGEHPDAGTCLSDFGLALHGVRHRDQIAGTLGYMAPEQLAGTRLGPSTDLFALGASAWALVTGTAPFRHGSVSDFTEDLWRGPPRAWTPRVPVPPDLRSWLDAMLANDTDHRIASAAEAAARLRELSSELVLPTTVPAPPGHAPSACETLVPSASMFELDGARAPASEPFATLVPSASMFDLPAPGADDTREPAPASTREAPVRPVPPTWPPEPRVLPGPPDLVPLRRGPLIARPVVQAALWRAVRDVAETGRSQTVALVGPEGSGRRTLARALQEAVDALGLGDRVSITRDGPEAMLLPGSLQLLRCTTPPPGVPALELPRVEASALEAMLCNLTPLTPTLASRLATAADGSPGLARALLDRLVLRGDLYAGPHGLDAPADATTTLPSAQRRAARASLDALCATEADLDALRIAAALAATGAPVPLDVWEGAAGGLPAGLQARSEAAAVIETASGAVRFRRPDVAWALRTDKRARRAHARCADWLSSHGAHPAEVGRHRAEAGQWEAALEVLLTTPAAPRALVQEAVDRLGLGPDDPRRRRVEGAARR